MEFRTIPSLENRYEISRDGKILRHVKFKHPRKFQVSNKGYLRTRIYIKGKMVNVFIASLVAEAWLGEKPDGYEVDHIDRNKLNNHADNLRYVTPIENLRNRSCTVAVTVKRHQDSWHFSLSSAAAVFLATKTDYTLKTCQRYLERRKTHISDFAIIYG